MINHIILFYHINCLFVCLFSGLVSWEVCVDLLCINDLCTWIRKAASKPTPVNRAHWSDNGSVTVGHSCPCIKCATSDLAYKGNRVTSWWTATTKSVHNESCFGRPVFTLQLCHTFNYIPNLLGWDIVFGLNGCLSFKCILSLV